MHVRICEHRTVCAGVLSRDALPGRRRERARACSRQPRARHADYVTPYLAHFICSIAAEPCIPAITAAPPLPSHMEIAREGPSDASSGDGDGDSPDSASDGDVIMVMVVVAWTTVVVLVVVIMTMVIVVNGANDAEGVHGGGGRAAHSAICPAVQGHVVEAERLLREALAGCREKLGPLHPSTLTAMFNLASLLESEGEARAAVPLFEEELQAREGRHARSLADTLAHTLT
eukprot:5715210-Pleurochrysis_carterae.AAC.1